jgi:biopolymer transport protein ExbD
MINKKLTVILLFLLTFFMIMSSVSASEIATTSDYNSNNGPVKIIIDPDNFIVGPNEDTHMPTPGSWQDEPLF